MKPRWKTRARLVAIAAGLALVLWLIGRIGPEQIMAQVSHVRADLLWLFAMYATGTAATALPWSWLLPPSDSPPLREVIASRFAASGINALLPFLGMGGEPVRLLWLRAGQRAPGVAGLIIDRMLHFAASAVFLCAGGLAAGELLNLPVVYRGALLVPGLLGLSGLIVGAALVQRRGVGGFVHGLVLRLRRLDRINHEPEFGRSVDARVRGLIQGPSRRLAAGFAVHLLGRALLGFEAYVGLLVLDLHPPLSYGLVLATVPVALSLVSSWIPSQIGVQEGAMAYVCAALGLAPAAGLTVVLLQRVRQVCFVSLAWAIVSVRLRKTSAAAT